MNRAKIKIQLLPVSIFCFFSLCFSLGFAQVMDIDPKDSAADKIDPAAIAANPQAKILEEAMEVTDVPSKIELVIDSSGSMAQILEKNKTKLFFLKKLVKQFMRFQWKEKNEIALRYYGGSPKAGCDDIKLGVNFKEKNLLKMEKIIENFEAGGRTPLHKTLLLAIKDVKDYPGPKRIVIITDGEDTCGGDPCKTVEEMKLENLDIKFYVVALGMSGASDTLKKVRCMGDLHMGNDGDSFGEAMDNISKKISHGGRNNLKVVSPNPDAVVYLYGIEADGKRSLFKSFYASSEQQVPPGKYDVVVGVNPLYKFENVTIPAKKKIVLRMEGPGSIKVNFFNSFLNVELLNKDNKPVLRFKSDVATKAPIGQWSLRIFKDPFYETVLPKFYVYPNGEHSFDVDGVGVVKVERSKMAGLYVYDQDNKQLGKFLTGFPLVIRSGIYTFHVDDKCDFPDQPIRERKEINVLSCPP